MIENKYQIVQENDEKSQVFKKKYLKITNR